MDPFQARSPIDLRAANKIQQAHHKAQRHKKKGGQWQLHLKRCAKHVTFMLWVC